VFVLHQVHKLGAHSPDDFEGLWRDQMMGAFVQHSGIRLLWYAKLTDPALRGEEAITMIGLRDVDSLARFCAASEMEDLASQFAEVQSCRSAVETRLLKPLRHNNLQPDFDAIPTNVEQHETFNYMHDFVPPRIGQRRAYEDAMVRIYGGESFTSAVALWAGMETVAGPIPEEINISRIQSPEVLLSVLTNDAPRESRRPGTWLYDALALRDRWTTRLVRCTNWSPTY